MRKAGVLCPVRVTHWGKRSWPPHHPGEGSPKEKGNRCHVCEFCPGAWPWHTVGERTAWWAAQAEVNCRCLSHVALQGPWQLILSSRALEMGRLRPEPPGPPRNSPGTVTPWWGWAVRLGQRGSRQWSEVCQEGGLKVPCPAGPSAVVKGLKELKQAKQRKGDYNALTK